MSQMSIVHKKISTPHVKMAVESNG